LIKVVNILTTLGISLTVKNALRLLGVLQRVCVTLYTHKKLLRIIWCFWEHLKVLNIANVRKKTSLFIMNSWGRRLKIYLRIHFIVVKEIYQKCSLQTTFWSLKFPLIVLKFYLLTRTRTLFLVMKYILVRFTGLVAIVKICSMVIMSSRVEVMVASFLWCFLLLLMIAICLEF